MTVFKVCVVYLAVIVALQFGYVPVAGSTSARTCSAEDFSLLTLWEESEDAVINTIQSVLPRLNSTMEETFLQNASSRVGGLHKSFAEVSELLYDVISNVYQLNKTKAGLNKFIEAIGEISSGYALACSSPPEVRPSIDDIPRLMNEFRVAFDEQDSLQIRFICGQMLCLHDHLSASEEQVRERRQTSQCMERKDCTCPSGGITTSIVCPCEFFACLDEDDKIKPLFTDTNPFQCLAFVIDTTGSMKDEIKLVTEVIKDFIRSVEDKRCYLLVPFNDDGSGPGLSDESIKLAHVGNLADHIKLLDSLENSFQQKSGGDCREYSYEAVKAALDHRSKHPRILSSDLTLRPGSQVIVLTDAPPKGGTSTRNNLREEIITKANNSNVCIHFFLPSDSFNCLDDFPDGVEEYKSIASSTGGLLIDSGFDFSVFASSYNDHPCHAMKSKMEKQKRDVGSRERCHSFFVSSLSQYLHLTAQTDQRNVVVTRPDNTTVKPKFITSPRKSKRLISFSEAEPQAGVWRVCVEKGSFENLMIKPEVSMDFVTLYYVQSDQEQMYLTSSPPPGCTAVRMAVSSSRSDLISSAQIQLLGENSVASYAELDKCGLSWTGNITLPSTGSYSYQLDAQDIYNNTFVYHTHKNVDYRSGLEYYNLTYTGEQDVTVEVGDRVELTFQIGSTNPYGPTTFKLKVESVEGFTYTTEPSEITLSLGEVAEVKAVYYAGSSSLQPGSSYTATMTASNGCATISASKNITIMVETPPPVEDPNVCGCVNGGTCNVITFGSYQFEICNCPPGFRGSRCEHVD